MNREDIKFLIGAILFLVGGLTASGYPPFDPSVWLLMFGAGMMLGCVANKNVGNP